MFLKQVVEVLHVFCVLLSFFDFPYRFALFPQTSLEMVYNKKQGRRKQVLCLAKWFFFLM